MATRPPGRWRERARRAIADALAPIDPSATERAKRAVLRDAYPFARRVGWAYTVWLQEVARLFPKKGHEKPRARFVLRAEDDGALRLDVDCTWLRHERRAVDRVVTERDAEGKALAGRVVWDVTACMMCAAARTLALAVAGHPDWRAFQDAVVLGDATALMAAKDWLRDRGVEFEEVRPKGQKKRGVRNGARGQ